MQKAHDASKNDWWRNLPDITTPITQDELNRVETTVDVIDDRVVGFDLSKANQSDLLQSIKGITYNTETGVWVFTWWNGSTLTVDQNIEKIPVSFSMSPQGIITMTTSDGTQYTCDIATLIKTYSFLDSDTIDFTDTVDSDGNHTITADIKNGSITGEKLQPNYLADCVLAKQGAETAETNAETAEDNALAHQYTAEAWAKGTKNNVPVTPSDAQYHDNAYYWAQQARSIVGDKVDSFNGRTGTVVAEDGDYESGMIVPEAGAISGQVPVVRNVGTGQDVKLRYVNEDLDIGLKPHIIVISETGSTVTLTKGTKVIYADETSPEHFEADVTEFGTWVIDSVLSGDDAQVSLVVDTVKIYTVDDSHYHADITVTYPTGGTCSCSKSGTTTLYATGSPYTFTVHESGTYTITATANGETYTDTVEVTTSGQTESLTIPEGSTVTPTDSVATLLSCAGIHDTSITSVSDLLADTTTLLAVINSNNAIDYLVRCTDWAGVGLVPVMTSDTTPSGECLAESILTDYRPYKAFDGDDSTWGAGRTAATTSGGAYIGYHFTSPVNVGFVKAISTAGATDTLRVEYSDDGTIWIPTTTSFNITTSSGLVTIPMDADYGKHSYWRLYLTATTSGTRMAMATIQFVSQNICANSDAMSYIGLNNYASDTLLADETWLNAICNSAYFESVLNVKVPTMTSDTAPRGQVLYGGQNVTQYGNYSAFYAFDGNNSTQAIPQSSANWNTSGYIGYKFTTPVKVRKVHEEAGLDVSRVETIQASTNGSSWVTLKSSYTASPKNGSWVTFNHIFVNNTAYQYYRISFGNPQSEGWNYYNNLQFYGR